MSRQALIEENQALKHQNASLKHQLDQLRKMIFGQKRERYVSDTDDPTQLSLFAEQGVQKSDEEKATEKITYERKKNVNHPGRNPLPDHLPVEEIIIEPDCDTTDMTRIGEEITETLDYTPGKLFIKRVIRVKYAKKHGSGIVIGKLPDRVIEKGKVESGLIANLIVSKFVDHLPFYRQQQIFKRNHNWNVSRSTINDWFASVCVLLEPLYIKLKEKILDHDYLQVDESTIKVLTNKKPGKTHLGFHWVYHAPVTNMVLFDYRRGRDQSGPKELLAGHKGYIQCDGYSVYDIIGRQKDVTLVGCMAHARRKFFESKNSDPQRSHYAMTRFKQIYGYEKQFRENKLKPEAIKAERNAQVKPLMEQILEWIKEEQNKVLPKSPIGQAMAYYQTQYHKLIKVCEDGRLHIDNNLIENVIRPLALGRKNYLFAGSHHGARRAAMMYSFFGSCKLLDINPWLWLNETLNKLPNHPINKLEELLPGYNADEIAEVLV